MPDGSIRFYQLNERKGGVPELVNGHESGIMPCIISGHYNHVIRETNINKNYMIAQINPKTRECRVFDIRKLTPVETYRLMDVSDGDIKKLMSAPLAASAHYKLAGNSIVVAVMEALFRQVWFTQQDEGPRQMTLFPEPEWHVPLPADGQPLRLIELCAGYGSQCMALERLLAQHPEARCRYDLTAWAEFDPESRRPLDQQPAVVAHNAVFPQFSGRNLGDMTKIDWTKFMDEYGLKEGDIDLLTYSTPCFVAGTLVMTADGLKPIESVTAEDRVLTHTNEYRQVVTPMQRDYCGNIVTVKPMFCDEIRCTDNHPFYVRTRYRKGHKWVRAFREPEWKEARLLTKDDYLGYAVNTESRMPQWEGTVLNFGGHNTFNPHKLRDAIGKEDFWYLMGRYLGDGWVRNDKLHKAMIICSSAKQEGDWVPIQRALERLGWRYTLNRERTTMRYTVYGKELTEFCQRYGKGAAGKHIDAETIALPVHLLKYFIMGYKDSDGSFSERDRSYHFTSVSYRLLLGLGQCIAKVYHRPFSITHCHMPHHTEIEGRRVNQRDFYTMRFKETNDPQDKAFYEDGYLWMPINHIEHKSGMVRVYNMEVDTDHSYTANGAIVHNCQSISQAGKRAGIAKGSGTRSSILWNTADAIEALRPKILMQENVAALVNQENKPHFDQWRGVLSDLGYDSDYRVLNAKDFGVPQNRERVFCLSWRRDMGLPHAFPWPQPVPLTRTIADVLEPDADPRYFLRPESVTAFLQKNESEQMIYVTTDHKPSGTEIDHILFENGVDGRH